MIFYKQHGRGNGINLFGANNALVFGNILLTAYGLVLKEEFLKRGSNFLFSVPIYLANGFILLTYSTNSFLALAYRYTIASLVAQMVESACNVGDQGSIPASGRSPGEGNGNPLQYSCLENPMNRGAWRATAHGVTQSRTRLSD